MADRPAIYSITNLTNGKKYIGSSKNVYYRLGRHKRMLRAGNHHSDHLQSAYNKYGLESFDFSIIEKWDDVDTLWKREQYYIDLYGTLDPEKGYNKTNAEPFTLFTEETRKKMSEAKKGKKQSEEFIKARAEGMRGHSVSDEAKRKIGEANKKALTGRHLSEEQKKKIGESVRKSHQSEETKQKLRDAANKRVYTDEEKKALSKKFKGKPRSEETKRKMREAWAKRRENKQ